LELCLNGEEKKIEIKMRRPAGGTPDANRARMKTVISASAVRRKRTRADNKIPHAAGDSLRVKIKVSV
jgi:hypothetical protein